MEWTGCGSLRQEPEQDESEEGFLKHFLFLFGYVTKG